MRQTGAPGEASDCDMRREVPSADGRGVTPRSTCGRPVGEPEGRIGVLAHGADVRRRRAGDPARCLAGVVPRLRPGRLGCHRPDAVVVGDGVDVHRIYQAAVRHLAAGHSLLAYPEGRISPDGAIGGFKDGAFILAVTSQVPVVPVAIEGTRGCGRRDERNPRQPGARRRWKSTADQRPDRARRCQAAGSGPGDVICSAVGEVACQHDRTRPAGALGPGGRGLRRLGWGEQCEICAARRTRKTWCRRRSRRHSRPPGGSSRARTWPGARGDRGGSRQVAAQASAPGLPGRCEGPQLPADRRPVGIPVGTVNSTLHRGRSQLAAMRRAAQIHGLLRARRPECATARLGGDH